MNSKGRVHYHTCICQLTPNNNGGLNENLPVYDPQNLMLMIKKFINLGLWSSLVKRLILYFL